MAKMTCPRNCGADMDRHHSSDIVNGGCDTGPMGLDDMIDWMTVRGVRVGAEMDQMIKDYYGMSEEQLDAEYEMCHGSMA